MSVHLIVVLFGIEIKSNVFQTNWHQTSIESNKMDEKCGIWTFPVHKYGKREKKCVPLIIEFFLGGNIFLSFSFGLKCELKKKKLELKPELEKCWILKNGTSSQQTVDIVHQWNG